MKTEILEITPEIARQMMSQNSKNRPINGKRVDDLARELSSGRFVFNGDTVRVDEDGILLDGQHRLAACIKTGISFQAVVVTGLPRSVMPTIDQHSKRTIGQVLSLEGVIHANQTAAIVRMIYGIATGTRFSARLTSTEVLNALERHPLVHDSTKCTRHVFPKMGSIIGGIHYIGVFLGRDDDADQFVKVWRDGIPSYDGCAVHVCRERMVRDVKIFSPTDRIKAAISAFNKMCVRESVTRVHVPQDPSIRGWSEKQWLGFGPK